MMNNLKKLLEMLEINNLHVGELLPETERDIFDNYNKTHSKRIKTNYDTHYLMKGCNIVHIGSVRSIENYVFSLEDKTE